MFDYWARSRSPRKLPNHLKPQSELFLWCSQELFFSQLHREGSKTVYFQGSINKWDRVWFRQSSLCSRSLPPLVCAQVIPNRVTVIISSEGDQYRFVEGLDESLPEVHFKVDSPFCMVSALWLHTLWLCSVSIFTDTGAMLLPMTQRAPWGNHDTRRPKVDAILTHFSLLCASVPPIGQQAVQKTLPSKR